jgi:hypothetical protein
MSEQVEVDYILTVNVEQAVSDVRQVEAVLMRTFSLMRRAGLPENVEQAIMKLQRLITTIRMVQQALLLVQAAMIPGAGIVAQVMAVVGVTSTAFVAADTYDYVRGAD